MPANKGWIFSSRKKVPRWHEGVSNFHTIQLEAQVRSKADQKELKWRQENSGNGQDLREYSSDPGMQLIPISVNPARELDQTVIRHSYEGLSSPWFFSRHADDSVSNDFGSGLESGLGPK